METPQKEITPEERQANLSRFIKRWKEEKQKTEEDAKAFVKSIEYQEILEKLKKKNAARGISIPGV